MYDWRVTGRGAWVLAAALLAGCGNFSLEAMATSPAAIEARAVADALARGDLAAVKATLDPRWTEEHIAQLSSVPNLFPTTAATRVHMVGFNKSTVVSGETTETTAVTFEHNYPDRHLLSAVALQSTNGGPRRTVHINVTPLPAPLETLNAFTLRGKGPAHYLVLVVMAGIAAVTIGALVVWVRQRRTIRRRWWWLLAILLGAFKITFDWTTGAVNIEAIHVQLLSLGYDRAGPYGPLTLTLAIPAGAIGFLIRRRKARVEAAAVSPAADLPPSPS